MYQTLYISSHLNAHEVIADTYAIMLGKNYKWWLAHSCINTDTELQNIIQFMEYNAFRSSVICFLFVCLFVFFCFFFLGGDMLLHFKYMKTYASNSFGILGE